jgi:ABC-2 type transport system permease protein
MVPSASDLRTAGAVKLLGDISTVLGIKTRMTAKDWYWFFIGALLFPLPLFYMLFIYVSDDPGAVIRIIAGTLVFTVSFSTANMTAQQFINERFTGTLKLMITAPVSKFAYVTGTLIHSSIIGAGSVVAILIFALATGIDIHPTWAFLPVIILVVLFLAGLTLFITSFAPTIMIGGLLANISGIILAMVSPVFFTMEQAPQLLRWFGYISPLRYAADAISTTLAGHNDVLIELAILSVSAIAAMSLGLWRLPWRES